MLHDTNDMQVELSRAAHACKTTPASLNTACLAARAFGVNGRPDLADFAASPQGEVKTTYFASVSSRTIVYKGMVQSCVLGPFYKDLTNELFQTNFAIYHRRFSTNTVPKWPLAQPMRCLAHNGEINTLIGNVNWQRALDIQVCPTR